MPDKMANRMTLATKPDIDHEHPQRERPEDEAMTRHEDGAIG